MDHRPQQNAKAQPDLLTGQRTYWPNLSLIMDLISPGWTRWRPLGLTQHLQGQLEFYSSFFRPFPRTYCDAPKPGGPLTTRQPAKYSWMSGNPTPLTKIGQSLLCTGSSIQGTKPVPTINNDHTGFMCK